MSGQAKRKMTLGMIVGNRGFFPDHLARTGHQEMKAALEAAGGEVIALTEAGSKDGTGETRQEGGKGGGVFGENRGGGGGGGGEVPEFGGERGIGGSLRGVWF